MRRFFYTLMLLVFGQILMAQSDFFKEANEYYKAEKYSEAYELYDSLASEGLGSFELFYNAGNAAYRKGDYARAHYYYLKAGKYYGSNDDLEHNIELTRARLEDKIEPLPGFFLETFWKNIRDLVSLNTWATIMIICSVLFSFFWFLLYSRSSTLNWLWYIIIGLSIFLLLFSGLMGYDKYQAIEKRQNAVIAENSAYIKSEPSQGSSDLFILHKGTQAEIIDTQSEWVNIAIPDGKKGWVKKSEVWIY